MKKDPNGEANAFLVTYAAFDDSSNSGRLTKKSFLFRLPESPFFYQQPAALRRKNEEISLFDYIKADDCIDGDVTPFITLSGDERLLSGDPKAGVYDCTVSVTNSIGDTTSLPVQVEIYEDSYEERSLRPSIELTENLIYLKQGEGFDPNAYLKYVNDGGTCQIDYGQWFLSTKAANGRM